MTQRSITFDEIERRFVLVRVPYSEPSMKQYTPYLRNENLPWKEKVVYFYANKADVSNVLGSQQNLPVAFRGKTNWNAKTVTCHIITDKDTLDSITKSIHERKFGA